MHSPFAPARRPAAGFTLMELMVAVAIVAILAVISVPSIMDRIVREQVVEAVKLADLAKPPIEVVWRTTGDMPADNAAAELPPPQKIVGNYVSAVTVERGAIHITFGNNVNSAIKDQTLTLRPAVVEDEAIVPAAWICANGPVPKEMKVQGADKTNIEPRFLPVNCRNTSSKE